MAQDTVKTPAEIRALRAENSTARARDFCDSHGISEAELVAAHVGQGATPIAAHPDQLMPQVERLGEVMALTRNISCVHERVGRYGNYKSGPHAAMILQPEIDLRLFPSHWVSAFALESETESGLKRSLQIFDAAGDAVHKIHLRETSNHTLWSDVLAQLATGETSDQLVVAARKPAEAPKANLEKLDVLRSEWARMTDTHQFMRLTSKLRMNRLGAYHLALGEKWVRRVENSAVETFLHSTSEKQQKVILFVGNKGNIQIHWGTLDNIKVMGPWLNVLDPKFNLHLRGDHIAETYVIEKPTKRGPAISLEAFDAEGGLIFQCFGQRTETDDLTQWADILAALPDYEGV